MSEKVLAICIVIVAVDLVSNLFILGYRGRWEEMKRAEIEMMRAIRGELEKREG